MVLGSNPDEFTPEQRPVTARHQGRHRLGNCLPSRSSLPDASGPNGNAAAHREGADRCSASVGPSAVRRYQASPVEVLIVPLTPAGKKPPLVDGLRGQVDDVEHLAGRAAVGDAVGVGRDDVRASPWWLMPWSSSLGPSRLSRASEIVVRRRRRWPPLHRARCGRSPA